MSDRKRPIPARVHLVRDVLDKALTDRNGKALGRVDRIVLELRHDSPPRIVRIEAGSPALAARLGKWPGRVAHALGRRFGLHHGRPVQFAWSRLRTIGIELELDVDKDRSPASAWERWLRRNVTRACFKTAARLSASMRRERTLGRC